MTSEARLFVVLLGLILILVVVRSLRARRLRFEYSLLWIVLGGLMVLLAAFQRTADAAARLLGFDYPPALFLLLCVFVVLLILFHLTLRISALGEQLKELVQQVALLERDGPEAPPDANDPARKEGRS